MGKREGDDALSNRLPCHCENCLINKFINDMKTGGAREEALSFSLCTLFRGFREGNTLLILSLGAGGELMPGRGAFFSFLHTLVATYRTRLSLERFYYYFHFIFSELVYNLFSIIDPHG